MTTTTAEPTSEQSFDGLYSSSRGDLYRALATIAEDRDLATEAIDVGFTRWRRKLRKPSQVPAQVGVMSLAYEWVGKQLKDSSHLSGFRLNGQSTETDAAVIERFGRLSLDERALLVMRDVLGWSGPEIAFAVGADGTGMATSAVTDRLAAEGYGEENMAAALRARAATFSEPLSRLETVKTKGMLQRVGAFAAGGALTVAVVAVAVGIAGSLGSSDPEGTPNDGTSAVSVSGLNAENAVWVQVSPPVNGDNITGLTHDGTNFVMLASDNQGRPVMMESDNGLDWAQVPGPPTGQNMYFQQIVAKDGVLMAVGGGFDDIRGRESTIVFTTGADGTWTRVDLPVEEEVEIGGQVFSLYTWVNSATASDGGFTILANQGAEFDPEQLLRGVVDPALLQNGWGTSSDGMQFFDKDGGQTTMTWEDLGLDPAVGTLLGGGRPVLWTSPDGVEWETVTSDLPPGVSGVGAFAATSQVEALMAWSDFGQSIWMRSGDEWARPDLNASLGAMTTWNDRLVVSGFDSTTGESAIWATSDGENWDRTLVPVSVQQLFASPAGIIGVGFGQDSFAGLGPAEIAVGDLTVLASSDGRFSVMDDSGGLLVEVYQENLASNGELMAITDPESGETVVEFERAAFERAWEAVYSEGNVVQQQPGVTLLISSDGINWEAIPSLDANFYPQAVAYGNNSILLTGWSEGGILGIGGGQKLFLVSAED